MAQVADMDARPAEAQLDMFGQPPAPIDADASDVRAEIAEVLKKARRTPSEPWAASDVQHLRNIFGRMAARLPAAEAAQLRDELETQLARLAK
jgi:hypothetical protein